MSTLGGWNEDTRFCTHGMSRVPARLSRELLRINERPGYGGFLGTCERQERGQASESEDTMGSSEARAGQDETFGQALTSS